MKVSVGRATVTAVFKTGSGFEHAGAITAESGCWSMLKGGLTVASSGPAELYFEVPFSIFYERDLINILYEIISNSAI